MPTRDEAKDLIKTFPVGQPMVVDSGGGYHVWLPLVDILDPRSVQGANILARWKRWWTDAFHARGLIIDEGVLADVARILRPAGTVSWKIPDDLRLVRLLREPGERVNLGDLDEQLPQLPVAPARPQRATKNTSLVVDDQDSRPGDALAVNVPVSQLLESVFGWQCKHESDREAGETARWWTPDGDQAYETHAATYADEGRGETVTLFDSAAQEVWGIPELTENKLDEHGLPLAPNQHRWTSWDVLGNVICRGDWRLAARIAVANPTIEALIDALQNRPTVDDLASTYGEVGDTTFSEALASRDGHLVFIDTDTYAVIGGPLHGLQKREKVQRDDGSVSTKTSQITNWIAYRPTVTRHLRINDQLCVEPLDTETYEVAVVALKGNRLTTYRRQGLSAKDSTNHRTVVTECNAGVALPSSPARRTAADNMLIVLGHDEQQEISTYTSMGWALIDNQPIYLCANGSVTPGGITDAYSAGEIDGSAEAGLNAVMRRTGFSGANMTIDSAISAIEQFVAIAPHRPELTIATLGLLFSAPLHLTSRAVVIITGESDSGKTLFSGAVQSFLADIEPRSKDTSALYIPFSSPTAATGIMSWHRDGVCIADDYRRTGDDRVANIRMTEVVNTIVQAGYGASSGAKATQQGGMRTARDQMASALVTAEVSADQTAVRNRSISIPLRRSDAITTMDGPLDAFLDDSARSGAARSVMARYIEWLATRAAEIGLQKLFAKTNYQAHDAYALLTGARNAETAAALLTGWQTFREFAQDVGVADRIPSEQTVIKALRSVVSANSIGASDTDPGQIVLRQLADMLTGNTGHLFDCNNERPIINGMSPGWMRSVSVSDAPNGGTTERWDPRGVLVGRLSKDGHYVLVSKTAINVAMKVAHLDGLAPVQVYDALAKFCLEGTTPGKRCPSNLEIVGRPDGFVIPLEAFGLDYEELRSDVDDETRAALDDDDF
ncbi:MAG: hypothetical protein ACYDEP_02550 [Acidimicrobiales bacterium]